MQADGVWTSVSEEVDGRPTSAKVVSERARTIFFEDDHCRMELTENGRRLVYDGTYQFIAPHFEFRFDGIDPEGKPAHFRGIVHARYDLLQLCFRHSADTFLPLPPKFKTEPNTEHVFELLTFTRHY